MLDFLAAGGGAVDTKFANMHDATRSEVGPPASDFTADGKDEAKNL
jgi:hypothetical protein